MGDSLDIRKQLAKLLDEVADREGVNSTLVDGVQVVRTSQPSTQRVPVIYQPRILVVGQGRKRVYLGDRVYQYDPFNYLVLSVPLPAECEWESSPDEPILMASITVEPTMLGEMLLELDEPPSSVVPTPRGISTTPMSDDLGRAVCRLIECLKCPLDSRILGRQLVREVVYRVLRGEQDGAL
ncbi:AraC family transcriptional regulator, partial [Singulisphaera rosea]